jgi:hypothetical protein
MKHIWPRGVMVVWHAYVYVIFIMFQLSQNHLYLLIHATHHHVERMPSAQHEKVQLVVHVYHLTKATPMWAVNQNVLLTQTVQVIYHVWHRTVVTLARVFVVLMLNVMLWTMFQCVHVCKASQVIPSSHADKNHQDVSTYFFIIPYS